MGLSSRVEYAFLALMELADCYNIQKALKICEISERHSLPERYLEQILSALRREGIVQSLRGAKGGYILAKEPRRITLQQVIIVIEGESKLKEAKQSQSLTVEKNVIYKIWVQANYADEDVFKGYTIHDLCSQRDTDRQENTMYYI